jgi:hypothetical protein
MSIVLINSSNKHGEDSIVESIEYILNKLNVKSKSLHSDGKHIYSKYKYRESHFRSRIRREISSLVDIFVNIHTFNPKYSSTDIIVQDAQNTPLLYYIKGELEANEVNMMISCLNDKERESESDITKELREEHNAFGITIFLNRSLYNKNLNAAFILQIVVMSIVNYFNNPSLEKDIRNNKYIFVKNKYKNKRCDSSLKLERDKCE